jgi:hypothetical protein
MRSRATRCRSSSNRSYPRAVSITDTFCESTLRVPGEHAFLIPYGRRLPFPSMRPVFTLDPSKSRIRLLSARRRAG